MNEKLLSNILLYQENLEELDKNLFNSFLVSMKDLYYFVSKTDVFVEKQETIDKIKQDKNYVETLENINALNRLGVSRDTKYKLLKNILENTSNPSDKILHTMIYTLYMVRAIKVKFLKSQQNELIDILKKQMDNDYTNVSYSIIEMFLGLEIIKTKYFLEHKTTGSFELYHTLNKKGKFNFNDMQDNDFINYLVKQFTNYRLFKPMSLVKNEISLKEAITPFLDQNIHREKQEILIIFLDMIRHKLSLDRENNEFLDKLVLNVKLNQKQPTQKEKKHKI